MAGRCRICGGRRNQLGGIQHFATVSYRECACKNPECDLYQETVQTIEIDRQDWGHMRQLEDPFEDVQEAKREIRSYVNRKRAHSLARRAADAERFRANNGPEE